MTCIWLPYPLPTGLNIPLLFSLDSAQISVKRTWLEMASESIGDQFGNRRCSTWLTVALSRTKFMLGLQGWQHMAGGDRREEAEQRDRVWILAATEIFYGLFSHFTVNWGLIIALIFIVDSPLVYKKITWCKGRGNVRGGSPSATHSSWPYLCSLNLYHLFSLLAFFWDLCIFFMETWKKKTAQTTFCTLKQKVTSFTL